MCLTSVEREREGGRERERERGGERERGRGRGREREREGKRTREGERRREGLLWSRSSPHHIKYVPTSDVICQCLGWVCTEKTNLVLR